MYINPRSKIAYVAHPRTASIATKQALMDHRDFERVCKDHHATVRKGRRKYSGQLDLNNWIIFSTVRNHYEVFRSWWVKKQNKKWGDGRDKPQPLNKTFVESLVERSKHFRQQYRPPFLKMFYHLPYCTHVARYEQLKKDVNRILGLRKLGQLDIPEKNVSPGSVTYQEVFDNGSRKLVSRWFGVEMKRLGYQW